MQIDEPIALSKRITQYATISVPAINELNQRATLIHTYILKACNNEIQALKFTVIRHFFHLHGQLIGFRRRLYIF